MMTTSSTCWPAGSDPSALALHQKLVIIDGLLAFKGSANLTLNGWRKAAKGLDLVEVVTDVNEVTQLHNEYFSPAWGQSSKHDDTIEMEDNSHIPF
jgi:hypothetical protein